jgi:uncharacterized membrane-anchored protein YjiN (DUF445 family)
MSPTIPTAGVYKIVHKSTGKTYVGQSMDVKHRMMRHKSDLKRSKHHIGEMQAEWDKNGEDAFLFELLEEIMENDTDIVERENYWIGKHIKDGVELYNTRVGIFIDSPHTDSCYIRIIGAMSGGKSLYITIPKALTKLFGWQGGDAIEITPDTEKQTLTLKKK